MFNRRSTFTRHLLPAALLALALLGCERAVPPTENTALIWNARDAEVLVRAALADHGRDAGDFFGRRWAEGHPAIHTWENTLALPGEPTRYVSVFTTTFAGNDCHGCSPVVSVFELTPTDQEWTITQQGIAVAQLGSWGSLGGPVGVIRLGGNRYAVTLRGGGTFQGITECVVELLLPEAGTFRRVLTTRDAIGDTSDRDWGEWEAELTAATGNSPDSAPSGYVDLVLRQVSDPNPPLENKYDLPAEKRFRFDGRVYQPIADRHVESNAPKSD